MSAVTDAPVLARYRTALREMYGDRLERAVLYGSRARGDARIVFRASRKFAAQPAMSFRHTPALRREERLRGMKPGKVGCASRRFVEVHAMHEVGFGEQSAGLGEEVSGFRGQSSIPSRRISRINGVRSL